jgi:hypothetical protein
MSNNLTSTTAATPSCYFNWTDEKKYHLAKLVQKNRAYKKTDLSMKAKFEIVYSQLKAKPDFESLQITAGALQNAFSHHQKAVLLKYGIDKEQVNLSGLSSEPSSYEKLLIDLAEEEYKESRKR